MEFATIKMSHFGNKFQVILPDGRDIAKELFIQRLEVMASVGEFTVVKLTCCAQVEARAIYPGAFNHADIEMGLLLANAVRHSGWR